MLVIGYLGEKIMKVEEGEKEEKGKFFTEIVWKKNRHFVKLGMGKCHILGYVYTSVLKEVYIKGAGE